MSHTLFQTLTADGCMDRHRHGHAYAALVLSGGYVESGDRGRFRAAAGDVLIHGAWESHMNAVSCSGARVLNLPFADAVDFGVARLADPDLIARAARRDLFEALSLFRERLEPISVDPEDWPDQLATVLRSDGTIRLETWAARAGLAPETISRGFRQVFGTTPKRYRAEQRALKAARALQRRHEPPAALAAELGFADQAHMSRAVVALTGLPPGRLRVKSVQSGAPDLR